MTGEGERRNRVKDFSFDFSYWSVEERSHNYASQERVSQHSHRFDLFYCDICSVFNIKLFERLLIHLLFRHLQFHSHQ